MILSKFKTITILIATMAILNACATLSKEECLAADWLVIGESDGAAGYAPQDRFAGHTKACSKVGIVPDQTLWNQGYQKGLVRYCTPSNGLRVGEAGQSHANVCPLDRATQFQEAYNLGKRAYDLRRSISSKRSAINSRKAQISEKFKKLNELTPEQRAVAPYELERLNLQNTQDEAEIARLSAELALAERDIQDYRLRLTQ